MDPITEFDTKFFHANIVTFPSNGILYFGSRETEFGTAIRAANWQCEKRTEPEDALFNAQHNSPNFYDFANWQILSENSAQMPSLLRLDAERVPSEEDHILFTDEATSKVFIDVPARVKAEMDSREHLQLRWPIDSVVTVIGGDGTLSRDQPKRGAELLGRPNSNFIEPQFSALCAFVRCTPTGPYCAEPVHAIGHCCPQCGAMLRFRKNSLNFTLALAIVDEFVRSHVTQSHGDGVSIVRVDRDEVHPLYQISVLPHHPSNFDEYKYCSIMWSVFRKVQQRTINAHLSLEYQPTDSAEFFDIRAKCSIQLGILHWRTVFKTIAFAALVCFVLAIAIHAHYRNSPSFRIFVHEFLSQQQHSVRVTWQRTRERVEMSRENTEEKRSGDAGGASFLAEFANRAFSWKMEKREEEEEEEEAKEEKEEEEKGGEEKEAKKEKEGKEKGGEEAKGMQEE